MSKNTIYLVKYLTNLSDQWKYEIFYFWENVEKFVNKIKQNNAELINTLDNLEKITHHEILLVNHDFNLWNKNNNYLIEKKNQLQKYFKIDNFKARCASILGHYGIVEQTSKTIEQLDELKDILKLNSNQEIDKDDLLNCVALTYLMLQQIKIGYKINENDLVQKIDWLIANEEENVFQERNQ